MTVNCAAKGDPVPRVRWVTSGQQSITQGDRAQLIIKSFDTSDERNYTCIAENALGSQVVAVTRLCKHIFLYTRSGFDSKKMKLRSE